MDYYSPPPLPDQTHRITGQLLGWLLSPSNGHLPDWNVSEWGTALWLAYHLKGMTWLAGHVRATGAPVPAEVVRQLFDLEANSRARTHKTLQLAVELMTALEHAGIPAMPLKGALLAGSYYADPCLRPLMDMDLLIPPAHFQTGQQILTDFGFEVYERSAKDIAYVRGQRMNNVFMPEHWVIVELHCRVDQQLENGLTFDLADRLWESSAPRPFLDGVRDHLPSRASLLTHVCIHATVDWFTHRGTVMQLMDIQVLVSSMSAADWQSFTEGFRSGDARLIYPALALAARMGVIDLPGSVLAQLKNRCPPALMTWTEQVKLADITPFSKQPKEDKQRLIRLLAQSWPEAAAMLMRLSFPRREDLYQFRANFGDSLYWQRNFPHLIRSPFWLLAYPLVNLYRMRRVFLRP